MGITLREQEGQQVSKALLLICPLYPRSLYSTRRSGAKFCKDQAKDAETPMP